jgi:hypothetical protein
MKPSRSWPVAIRLHPERRVPLEGMVDDIWPDASTPIRELPQWERSETDEAEGLAATPVEHVAAWQALTRPL